MVHPTEYSRYLQEWSVYSEYLSPWWYYSEYSEFLFLLEGLIQYQMEMENLSREESRLKPSEDDQPLPQEALLPPDVLPHFSKTLLNVP